MTVSQKPNETQFAGIYRTLMAALGEPEQLHRTSPLCWCDNALEVLLATILTQATSDRNALQAWRNLKQLCKEPSHILDLDEGVLVEAIKPAGLMTQRAKTLTEVLRTIHDRFGEYKLNQLAGDPGLAWENLGRRYCRPTAPDCSHCPLFGECRFNS